MAAACDVIYLTIVAMGTKNSQLLFTYHNLIDELMLKIEAGVWNYALILSDYISLRPEQHQQSPPS